MASGFGRKGGHAARSVSNVPNGPAAAMRPVERDDGLSPAARAFLASERLRQETEPSAALASTESGSPRRSASAAPRGQAPKPTKSLVTAYVLWWFGSPFAAHRLYLGAYYSGITMAFLFWRGLGLGALSSKKSSMWVGGTAVPPYWAAMILGSGPIKGIPKTVAI